MLRQDAWKDAMSNRGLREPLAGRKNRLGNPTKPRERAGMAMTGLTGLTAPNEVPRAIVVAVAGQQSRQRGPGM